MELEQNLEANYINLMSGHSQLEPDFWLQFIPFPPFTSDRGKDFQWNPRLVSLIESKAATHFLDLTISERHVAQSAMLLASLLGDTDRSGRQQIDLSEKLIPVLAKRLHELAKTPQRLDSEWGADHFQTGTPCHRNTRACRKFVAQRRA